MRRPIWCAIALIWLSVSTDARAAAGRTPTSFNVSQTGEAIYSIPIFTPPGTHGMTAQMAFVYGHRAGGSLVGAGWGVTGLSAISRCELTFAQDGQARDVRNDWSDKYCLDGNRLRVVAGGYGGDGSEYRTEIETFARIRSYGIAGNGPAYFYVERKDGLIYEYGATSDSRIESVGQTTVRTWALSKIRDREGNAILLTYFEDASNGSFRIELVQYTSNPGQGLSPAYSVDFFYETKPVNEIDSGYFAGSIIREVTRLDRVDVLHNSSLVRRYELTYEPTLSTTSRSRLASIQECAAPGTDCFSPTTFTYQDGSHGLSAESAPGIAVTSYMWLLDLNGDGRDDLAYPSDPNSGSGYWMVALANSSGGFAAPVNTGIVNYGVLGAIRIDYNADGLQDLLVAYSGGTWWALLGTASGLAAPINTGTPAVGTQARAIDIDGDGLEDLVWSELYGFGGGDAVRYRLRVWGGTFSSTVTTLIGPLPADEKFESGVLGSFYRKDPYGAPDFNGDGRKDIVYRHSRREWDPELQRYNFFYTIRGHVPGGWTFQTSTSSASSNPQIADFNGDGKTDLLYYTGSNWRYQFSRGTSLGGSNVGPSILPYLGDWVILDWDGDGYDDVLAPHTSSSTWHIMRSTGESLLTPIATGMSWTSGGALAVADTNGDALKDLAYSAASSFRFRTHAGVYPDLLRTGTDGFGNPVTFNYAPITNSDYYQKYADAVFPEQDFQAPVYVVTSSIAANGIGGTFTRSFFYYGARVHLQGRGFEGFYSRRIHDSRNDLYSYDYFNRLFPYTATTFRSDVVQPNNATLIRHTENSWTAHGYSSGYEARFYLFVQSTSTHSYEVGGTFNGAHVRTVSTTNQVDAATGALYDSTTTVSEPASANGAQSGANYVQRTYHPLANLFNDYTYWCFGRPGVTQQINSHNLYGGGAQTRQVNTSWNGALCRRTQQQHQPGDPQWQVTVDLGYDGYGNVNSETVTGIGMPARTSTSVWASPGSFPTSISRPVSASFWETTQKGWNYALGVQASETDPNGILTSWQHDNFARKTLETRADGTDTVITYNDCASFGCQGSNNKMLVIEQMRDTADAVINDRWTYFDKFDRAFLSTTRQLSGAWDRAEITFDGLGRVSQRSAPCWWASCTYYWTTSQYDLLNRLTQESRPVSDSDPTIQTSYAYYEGATNRSVDAQGKQKTTVVNALGAAARSIDHAGYYQSFDYDAFGNSIRVMDSAGNTLQSATFNTRGMRLTASDMDAGNWTFTPNALGEPGSQTDANEKTTSFTWDFQSRPLTRMFPEGGGSITSTWTWGQSAAAKNIGKLASTQISGTGLTTYGEAFTFDSLGRPAQTQVTEGSNVYNVDVGYSPTTGFVDTLTYPTSTSGYRLKVQYEYQYGHLLRVKDFNAPTTVFWQANATDARGQMTDETLGNGLRTTKSFDAVTGWIDYIRTGPGGGTSVQNLSYLFDKVGNLTQRQDGNQSLTENFFYDDLYRLDYSTLNSLTNLNVDYDALGNITFKSDVGSYTYHATKKHAVVTAGPYGLSYDANGNLISTTPNSGTATWYANNLPRTIAGQGSLGPTSSEFFYGPDQRRWKQVTSYAGVTEETIYIAGILEKVTQGSVTAWKHYITGGSGPAALYIRKSDGSESTHYFARDHLGSVDSISDAAGAVQVRLSYSAFGRRRNGAGWSGEPPGADFNIVAGISRRGFTDHEMLDNLSLVHMNGRVYNPLLGRFISADLFIDGVMDTQGWNRYSYVKNNPLSFTDPTGYLRTYYRVDGVTVEGRRTRDDTRSYGELLSVDPDTGDLSGNESGGGGSDNSDLEEVLVSGSRDGEEEPPEVLVVSTRPRPIDPDFRRSILGDAGLWGLQYAPGYDATDCLVRITSADPCGGAETFMAAAGVIPATRGAAALGAARALPVLDRTGKAHGALPRAEDLGRYTRDELRQLQQDLRQSVQERIRRASELGADRAHGQRQAAEQQLITQLERFLSGS